MNITINNESLIGQLSILVPLFVIIFLSIVQECQCSNKIKMQVFYETYCPDSLRFLQNLGENYDEIHHRIELQLVPFGKAKIRSDGTMVCQHGPNECSGNKWHACTFAMKTISVNQTIDFIYCWSNRAQNMLEKPFELGRQCLQQLHGDDDDDVGDGDGVDRRRDRSMDGTVIDSKQYTNDIEKCARGRQGEQLMLRAASDTPINIDFVPTIIFNNIYKSQDTSWTLFDDLPAMLDKLESRMRYRD